MAINNVLGIEVKRRLQDITDIKKESGESVKRSLEAKEKADDSAHRSDITKKQLDEALKNGDQVVEVQTLRVDPLTGKVYNTASDRLEADQRKTNEQLSKTEQEIENVKEETKEKLSSSFRVATSNIQVPNSEHRYLDAIEYIKSSKADYVGLQEIRQRRLHDFKKRYMIEPFVEGLFFPTKFGDEGEPEIDPTTWEFGVGNLSVFEYNQSYGNTYKNFNHAGRGYDEKAYTFSEVLVYGQKISIYNTHATISLQSDVRDSEIAELVEIVRRDQNEFKIVMGDFNAGLESLTGFTDGLGLTSVVGFNGVYFDQLTGKEVSYETGIDHIFVTPNLEIIKTGAIHPGDLTDHALIYADLKFLSNVDNVNSSLLSHENTKITEYRDVHNLLKDGRIIEDSGSNENGEYIRFSDGTQICAMTVSSNDTGANSYHIQGLDLYRSSSFDVTMPVPFLTSKFYWTAQVINLPDYAASFTNFYSLLENTKTRIRSCQFVTLDERENRFEADIICIGRWK